MSVTAAGNLSGSSYSRTPTSGSVSSSNSYEQLLSQTTALQAEVQRSALAIKAATSERDQLRANYDALKAELFRTKERYEAARKDALDAVEAKIESERNTELYVSKWKQAYEEITQSYEDLQAKYAPQDIELLRIQVANELEARHAEVLAAARAGAEAHEAAHAAVRRELAALKAVGAQQEADFVSEVDRMKEENDRDRLDLRTQLETLRAQLEEQCAPKDEEIRVLSRSLYEEKAACQALKDELAAVRKREEAAELSKFQAVSSQHDEVTALQALLSDARATANTAARRAKAAEEKVAEHTELLHAGREKLSQSECEVDRLRALLTTKESQHSESLQARESELARTREQLQLRVQQLSSSLEEERQRADSLTSAAREAIDGANERQKRLEGLEEELKRHSRQAVQALQEEVERLEQAVAHLEARGKAREEESRAATSRLRREAEAARGEASRASRERDAAVTRLAAMDEQLTKAKGDGQELRRERDEHRMRADGHANTLKSLKDREKESATHLESASARISDLEAEIASMSRQWEEKRVQHAAALNDLRKEAAARHHAEMEKARAEDDAKGRKLGDALRREKRRAAAYKQKAIDAHNRFMRAKQALTLNLASATVGDEA